jgi:very-long-chain (3R)-3-hydroxyacyl-CoA dehydratase
MSSLRIGYLFSYNAVQFVGWSFLLYEICNSIISNKHDKLDMNQLYNDVSFTLQIFQTGAALEILHAALGLVRSNVQITFQQVFSRLFITWGILHLLPTSRSSVGVICLLFAWTITEMIRYSMYAIQLISSPPYFLTWLRYTFFIIAYPVGVSGELLCKYTGFWEAKQSGILSINLPNSWNFTFQFWMFIGVLGCLYIPLFPPMYLHMFAQRRKILGGGDKKKGE